MSEAGSLMRAGKPVRAMTRLPRSGYVPQGAQRTSCCDTEDGEAGCSLGDQIEFRGCVAKTRAAAASH
jgi:hypothetical protein